MLAVSQNFKDATESETRNIKARITMKGVTYTNSDIFNVEYNGGSVTGETFNIGSTFSNNIKVTFSSIIEELLLDDQVKLEFGVVLSDSTIEYVKMGTFFITSYDPQRNDFKTVIEASDKMIQLNSIYKSKLTYPARIKDVAIEIANLAGVQVNTTSFSRINTSLISQIQGYTFRQAIGLIAQFECGYALFDRNGQLDIRMLSDPEYAVNPSDYFSKGLTKNEVKYTIGGIRCTVVQKKGDSSEMITLQSGSTSGAQVSLENNVMTQMLLDAMYQKIRTVNYFPFTLNWRGNPALEAGDWITVVDIRGNRFKVPNLNYKLSFSGGLKAVSSANTQTVSASSYQYKGNLQQQIYELSGRIGAAGNHVYDGLEEPVKPKEKDLWFKPNGPDTEIWIYQNGEWVFQVSAATNPEIAEAIEQAQTEATEAKTAAQDAVDKANASVAAVQANTQLINDVNAIANNAKTQAQTAATNAQTALTSANTANTNANKAIGDVGKLSEDVLALDTIANQAKSDADTALINANKGITDAKTALDKAIGVDTRVTTEITNVNNTFATKANSTTVDALSDTVSSQGTAISQNATDIKLKADSTVVNAIKGTVDSQGTLISQNSKDIALKANKSSVDTLTGRVSANETAIDITSQGVSTLVTKTDGANTSLSQFKQDYEGFKGTVYSKTQTDTKISTVQSTVDNFKTTVSNTYSSKSETDSKVTAVQANVDKLGTNISYAWSLDGKDRFTRVKPIQLFTTQLWKDSEKLVLNNVPTIKIQAKPNTKYTASTNMPLHEDSTADVFFFRDGVPPSNTNGVSFGRDMSLTTLADGLIYVSIRNITNSEINSKYYISICEGTISFPSPEYDYDNAVPRYIGRSLKDSNSPSDYKWEPNPERKPWTAYAKGLNGEGLSLMPYGEQLQLGTNQPFTMGYGISNTTWKDGWAYLNTQTGSTALTGEILPQNGMFFNFTPEAGKTYTQSIRIKTDGKYNPINSAEFTWYISDGHNRQKTSILPLNNNEYLIYSTCTWNKTGKSLRAFDIYDLHTAFGFRDSTATYLAFKEPKLELANTMNIPTPWTPAPSEDPLGAIPKYVGTAALPYEDPYKYEWRLSSDWNQVKTSTEFEQTDKEIGLKADQTTVNAITGRVSTAEGSISTMAGQIKLKANQTDVDTVKGRVSTAEGSISLISGQVALKANQADVNTTNGKVSSLESSFTVQSGQILALNTKTDGHTTQIGSLQSSYSGLVSTVANTYLTKTDATNTYPTKTSVASQITQSATAVTSNVQSWTNDKLTAYSTTQQTANSITNAVADKADKTQITQLSNQITSTVDGLVNTNLLSNSEFLTKDGWNALGVYDIFAIGTNQYDNYNGSNTLRIARNSNSSNDWWGVDSDKIRVYPGQKLSIGAAIFLAGAAGIESGRVTVNINYYKDSSSSRFSAVGLDVDVSKIRQKNYYLVENKIVPEGAQYASIYIFFNGTGNYLIGQPKFVIGEKIGIYTPAKPASQSQITQLSDMINLRVSKGDVTSQINLESGRVLIDSKQLLLNADTVKFSGSAFIPDAMIQSITANKITAGTINAADVNVINLNAANITTGTLSGANLSMNLNTGAVQFRKGYIEGNNGRIRLDLDNSYLKSFDTSNKGFEIQDGVLKLYSNALNSSSVATIETDIVAEYGGVNISAIGGVSLVSTKYKASIGVGTGGLANGNEISLQGNAFFWNGISVLGKKNAVHVTRDGVRATPAYETAESYLGDIGGNYTRENCEVWVDIEKLFSDTVNTDIAYHVFLQAYDDAHFWVAEFKSDKFLIKSNKPMARFAWEIKAKRRGYENDRLVIQEGVDNKILLEAHSEGIFKGDSEDE